MAYKNDDWQPHKKSAELLNRAMEHLQSVSYQVSVRWVFYRLLQDGLYSKKSDYLNFVQLTSRARHGEWNGWTPQTLADETRDMLIFPNDGERPEPDLQWLIRRGVEDAKEEKESLLEQYENYRFQLSYDVDPNYYQDCILLVMFEARAMSQQFQLYTDGLTLCPFGGQPSIPFKYRIAKYIERQHEKYAMDVVVLYFGDLDEAGVTIFKTGV